MNYKKIHDTFIQYCNNTAPKMRLLERNSTDVRLNEGPLYVEIHHIIPRSLGGLDNPDNLVEVLPEEHIFLHMLRYKIHKKREDALAVRYMLNGFSSNERRHGNLACKLTKKLRMGYAWIRTHAQSIRETNGWHTLDGKKRISEARKGMIPVKDLITGERIGSVSNKHPNVISGKWVHHTKGRKISESERVMRSNLGKGQNNCNASGLSDEYLIQKGMEAFQEFGFILTWPDMLRLSNKRNFRWLKGIKSRFNGRGKRGYFSVLEEKTRTKLNSYIHNRSKLNIIKHL